MSCRKTKKTLSGYLDDRLTSEARADFEAHVADCDECRETLRLLQAAKTALAADGPAEPPPDLAARATRAAFAAADTRKARPSFIDRWTRVAWPAAAAATVTAVALLLFAGGKGNGIPSEEAIHDPVAAVEQIVSPPDEVVVSVLAVEEE
jgi:anti-sigma factor RsiW